MIKNNISERLEFLGLDEKSRQILRELKPALETEIPRVLQRLQDSIERWPHVNALFENQTSKARVGNYQIAHWDRLLSADFDDEFLHAAEQVARDHCRTGLTPQWYISGYSYIIGELLPVICRNYSTGGDLDQSNRRDTALAAFVRAVLLDMELTISVTLGEGDEAVRKEVDQRKWTEAKLAEEASELETALAESEAFSYAVSHDLRAPLRAIDGFSHALEEDYADKLDETGKNLLQRVRLAAARMETLIDDLLKLSRVGRASVQPAVVDLSAMAGEIVQTLKETHPDRQVAVTIEPELDEECDRRLMNVVLTNLLDNAWKYTRMQPSARIEFGREWLDGKTRYYVRDNGVGFDMAYADKLFQPFQRLHSIKDFPGSGIGLATVAKIIQLHGGHIEAQSEPGKGATFTFVVSNHHKSRGSASHE